MKRHALLQRLLRPSRGARHDTGVAAGAEDAVVAIAAAKAATANDLHGAPSVQNVEPIRGGQRLKAPVVVEKHLQLLKVGA